MRRGPTPDRTLSVPAVLGAISKAGLVLLVLLAPLPFGSVSRTSIFVLGLWVAALGWLVLATRPFSSLSAPVRHGSWLLLASLAIGALHIVPLPRSVASLLSPRAVARLDALPWGSPASWVPVSAHPEATRSYLARLAALGVLFLVAAALASRERGYRAILGGVLGAGVFQALYGSYEYLSGHDHIFAYVKRFYTDAATGTYINQNHFAGALEMAFLAGLGFILARRPPDTAVRSTVGWRQRVLTLVEGERAGAIALATAVAVVGLGLVLSYSRAGLASAALASAVVLWVDARRHRGRRRRGPILVLLGSVLVLVTLAGWGRVGGDLWRQMQAITWEEGRIRVWRDSLAIVQDHPILGTGLGTFQSVYPAYRSPRVQLVYEHAHNDYLQLLVEAGIVGTLLALLVAVAYWGAVIRAVRRRHTPDLPLLLGAAGGLLSLMLHETIDFNLQIPANAALFSALAGALIGALHPSEPDVHSEGAPVVSLLSHRTRRVVP